MTSRVLLSPLACCGVLFHPVLVHLFDDDDILLNPVKSFQIRYATLALLLVSRVLSQPIALFRKLSHYFPSSRIMFHILSQYIASSCINLHSVASV